ncbi:MAG: hypothetical protein KKH97_08570 [Proteobacteria bacterium]|nr:hypothetical protein [Pseudomonadota bacterium]MBU1713879.1 hypothetical protein [Pseudomonadota bacterium]
MKFILNIKYIVTGVLCIILLHGCMGGMAGWKGHIVRKDNRIPLEENAGKVGGVWKTGDLLLKYDYLIRGDRIQLEGEATLTDKLTHFTTLDHLSIMVQFLDREGITLGHEILYISSSRDWIPLARLSFSRSFVLPSETASISFSYSGKVSDGSGDDGIDWNFWSTP